MKTRHLVSTRRTVPEARRSAYDAAWTRLQAAATERGAHAWRFRSADHGDLFLEFLEFADDADPRGTPRVAALLHELDSAFGSPPLTARTTEEWRELRE